MELKFNEAKTVRPGHLERCLCYDKFLKGYRCYVYDDISKYWCTQATTEHDPNGDNHIVDYADFQVTEWASLSSVNKPSLPSDLDEAAEKFARDDAARMWDIENKTEEEIVIAAFKAGTELMACLALTPDDITLIIKIYNEVLFRSFKVRDMPSEILRRFNEQRKK